jgi:hypothetical protein
MASEGELGSMQLVLVYVISASATIGEHSFKRRALSIRYNLHAGL